MFWFNFLVYYKPFRLTVDFKEIINEYNEENIIVNTKKKFFTMNKKNVS